MGREDFAAIGAAAPAPPAGQAAFEDHVAVAGAIGDSLGREMGVLFGHPFREVVVFRFVTVAVGIDNQIVSHKVLLIGKAI